MTNNNWGRIWEIASWKIFGLGRYRWSIGGFFNWFYFVMFLLVHEQKIFSVGKGD